MKNLKNLRLKNEYSQFQLAEFMDVGTSVICRWENGFTLPTPAQTVKLCRILNCSPRELFTPVAHQCDNTVLIPLFEDDTVTLQTFPACGEETADFGIVLSENIADRLFAGDICYFRISSHAQKGSIVLTGNGYDARAEVYNDSIQNVIAVCTSVHCPV